MANTTQSVGKFTAVFSHPLINGGASTSLTGFKLDSTFFSTAQSVENSKRVPLVDNTTAGLTNSQKSGRITWTCTRTTSSNGSSDVMTVSRLMVAAGDSIGGTLTITTSINGTDEKVIYYNCTSASNPPQILAGNNVPDYTVIWDYADFAFA
jgi:hypothetical protein